MSLSIRALGGMAPGTRRWADAEFILRACQDPRGLSGGEFSIAEIEKGQPNPLTGGIRFTHARRAVPSSLPLRSQYRLVAAFSDLRVPMRGVELLATQLASDAAMAREMPPGLYEVYRAYRELPPRGELEAERNDLLARALDFARNGDAAASVQLTAQAQRNCSRFVETQQEF